MTARVTEAHVGHLLRELAPQVLGAVARRYGDFADAEDVVQELRAVGGLTTAEIARAFLVPEATMVQRISRAKQTIKSSGTSFSMPGHAERAQRLSAVLHILYLTFN